jgi:hypothetical protein
MKGCVITVVVYGQVRMSCRYSPDPQTEWEARKMKATRRNERVSEYRWFSSEPRSSENFMTDSWGGLDEGSSCCQQNKRYGCLTDDPTTSGRSLLSQLVSSLSIPLIDSENRAVYVTVNHPA